MLVNMRKLFALFARFTGLGTVGNTEDPSESIDDSWLIHLDAEDLAEGGIKRAYDRLLPELGRYVAQPVEVEECLDEDAPRYTVKASGVRYAIYGPEIEETAGSSWGKAAFSLFDIVNRQLTNTSLRFYAINGGNDLCGKFLTELQVRAEIASHHQKQDWPYLPNSAPPWYGQHH